MIKEKTKIDEHLFPSGDVPDILFELIGNKNVVVEIETDNPLPGFYQVLKYKVLRCAELGLDIDCPDVEAVLVAWKITKEIKNLCKKYRIRFVQKKL
ncbi:MAG: hypothetical protein ABIK90_01355 [candidate division WOR-3 bacterium]